jgi:hypothetical protein
MMIRDLPGRMACGIVAASLAVLGVAACGGGSAGSTAATSAGGAAGSTGTQASGSGGSTAAVHACSLLTAAQASTIVGAKYTAAHESMGGSMCSYTTTSAPIPLFIIISGNQGGAAAWKEELSTIQEDAGEAPITLSGIGSHAAGGGTEIGVQDGSYIIDVHGGDPTGQGSAFPKSLALAKTIISGLH